MTTHSAGEIVNVRVRLNQILDTTLNTAGAFAAPTGMTVSYEGTNITVQPGSIVKDGVVFKLDAPITKNTAELWMEGDLSGGSLDSPFTENWETPVMENNTTPEGYEAFASSNLEQAYLAFDSDEASCWTTEAGEETFTSANCGLLFKEASHKLDFVEITLNENQPQYCACYITTDLGVSWKAMGEAINTKNNQQNVIKIDNPYKETDINGIKLEFTGAVDPEAKTISVYNIHGVGFDRKTNIFVISNGPSFDVGTSKKDDPDLPVGYTIFAKIGQYITQDGNIISVYPTKDLADTFIDDDLQTAINQKADLAYVNNALYTKVDKVKGKSLVDDTQIEKLFNLLNIVDLGVQETEEFLDTEVTAGFYGYTLSNLPETTATHKYVLNNVDEEGKVTQLVFDGIHTKTRVYTPAVTEPEEIPASWTEWVDNYLITPEFLEKLEEDFAKKADKEVVDTHIANTENPHAVTKAQVGLGSVDNTADLDKPISTATQAALDGKQPVGDYALKSELPDTSTFATKTEVTEGLSGKADKANTLAGYGITDAYTRTEADGKFALKSSIPDISGLATKEELNTKADSATTLSGYGITDAYTKTQSDGKYATTAQGAKADTAVQPAAIADMLTTTEAESTYAKTSALSTVATTGSYNDLTNKPSIPTLNKIATLLRVNKTGLNETIDTGTQKDLLTLVSLTGSDDNVVTVANIEATDFTLTSGALKLPNYTTKGYSSTYCDYNVDIRLTGTIAGDVNTSREFALELQRADNTLLERKAVIKVNDTTLGSRGTVFETYTIGADDPFIANGLRLVLNNTSGQTITLTGLSVIIKCVTF